MLESRIIASHTRGQCITIASSIMSQHHNASTLSPSQTHYYVAMASSLAASPLGATNTSCHNNITIMKWVFFFFGSLFIVCVCVKKIIPRICVLKIVLVSFRHSLLCHYLFHCFSLSRYWNFKQNYCVCVCLWFSQMSTAMNYLFHVYEW
jgi:hypothetical protein